MGVTAALDGDSAEPNHTPCKPRPLPEFDRKHHPQGEDPAALDRDSADWRRRFAARLRRATFWLLLQSCRQGGAAFIKWGQWSATREDIFPRVRELQ